MFSEILQYREDIQHIASFGLNWEKLKGKSILVTGATGLIGTVLVDAVMYQNAKSRLGAKLIVLSRNKKKLVEHFAGYKEEDLFVCVECDITEEIMVKGTVDYIVNLAGNTHPALYATEPIETIKASVLGVNNLLEFATTHGVARVINASSVEVYGENRGDTRLFKEDYCGYIDCNTLRAAYPEAKRLAEALGQAFIAEKGLDVISARLGRVYGASTQATDTKSTTQFIRSAVNNEDIVLKSNGDQEYSYVYVADAVTALLLLLVKGSCGEAYNIGSDEVRSLREVAGMLAAINGKDVKIELPNESEKKGFSIVQTALMDSTKVKNLGWEAKFSLQDGLQRTVAILRGPQNANAQ